MISLYIFFFFNDTATTEIYTLSLHDALPIYWRRRFRVCRGRRRAGPSCLRSKPSQKAPKSSCSRRSKRWRSEEHTSELQSRQYLVCRLLLEKKKYNIYIKPSSSPVTHHYYFA